MLFTGFEPSGDDHASSVIAELKRRDPSVRVFAWGGKKMEAAGATLVEHTGRDAVMGMPGLAKIREHQRINQRVKRWLEQNPVTLHVPVDSPAANFPICELTRESGAMVMHLVAPQMWAWGSWRIRKLRRLTDHVCCLLPFEEAWFKKRGVSARFVGHPLFDEVLDRDELAAETRELAGEVGEASPRLALMPGSRPAEIEKNFPLMLNAFRRLAREHDGLAGLVAATTPEVEKRLKAIAQETGGWPDRLHIRHGKTDAVIAWSDLAIVVSGTVTLQVARQAKPMVIVYKSSRLMYWLLARWLLNTPFFSLPNLIAEREAVPELVPHFGGAEPIVDEVVGLLERPELAEEQRRSLEEIAARFKGYHAAASATDEIQRLLRVAHG